MTVSAELIDAGREMLAATHQHAAVEVVDGEGGEGGVEETAHQNSLHVTNR